jgi:hypothetical protein
MTLIEAVLLGAVTFVWGIILGYRKGYRTAEHMWSRAFNRVTARHEALVEKMARMRDD